MPIEIGGRKLNPTNYVLDGKELFARKMPLQIALKMQSIGNDGAMPPELVAEFISSCVVYEDGGKVWSANEVLEFEADAMMKLFSEASGVAVSFEEAEKN